MKTKILASMFLAVLLLSVLSVAALSFDATVSQSTLSNSVNSTVLTIKNNEAVNLSFNIALPSTITDGTHTAITVTPSSALSFTLANGTSTSININLSSLPADLSSFYLGNYPISLLINATNVSNAAFNETNRQVSLSYNRGYCKYGPSTNSSRYIEITNLKDVTSENDWKWKPGDKVQVDVKMRYDNTGEKDDSVDAVIELALYDTVDKKFIDFDNQDDLERSITIDEGSTQTESFILEVPIEDTESSSSRYKLYFKVYEDGRESSLCTDVYGSNLYKAIEIKKNSYEVSLKDVVVTSPASCGQEATITATAWNIGNNDESKVFVQVDGFAVGVKNLTTGTFSLDKGESKKITLSFMVPKNISDGSYELNLISYFRYSKSADQYKDSSETPFRLPIKVENCQAANTGMSITAELSAETPKAVIGSQAVVQATVKNTGAVATTYNMEVSGNSAWSKVAQIDPQSFTLAAGESKVVNIYLNIASDVAVGDRQFTIRTSYAGITNDQNILVTLEEGLTKDKIVNHLKNYWYLYVIAVITLILIIVIISILVKRND